MRGAQVFVGKSIYLSLGSFNSFLHAGPLAHPPNQSSSLGPGAQKVEVQFLRHSPEGKNWFSGGAVWEG